MALEVSERQAFVGLLAKRIEADNKALEELRERLGRR